MRFLFGYFVILVAVCTVAGCAGGRQLALVEKRLITADVAVGSLDDTDEIVAQEDSIAPVRVFELEGDNKDMIVMYAVKDEESGNMIATDQLDEIVVVAKFKHVAERNGSVDLVFELLVPVELQGRKWQVRFTPKYFILGDTLHSDQILITGDKFRKVQDWEHFMYDNYMEKVVPDAMADSLYSNSRLLRIFERRMGNRGIYMHDEAKAHYRKGLLEKINRNMARGSKGIYDRFVVDPYPRNGVRLDSVVYDRNARGIRYYYVQNIKTVPGLKKVDMVMDGEIYTNGRKLCSLAGTQPITFYISSMSFLADNSERYMKKVVYRDLHLSTSYNLDFRKGDWNIDPGFSSNGRELSAIKMNIAQILGNEDYAMDSIMIAASGSPDGKFHVNEKISAMRGASLKEYVQNYVDYYRDSVRGSVWEINEDETYGGEIAGNENFDVENIFVCSVPEDWDTLLELVGKDTSVACREEMLSLAGIQDVDAREDAMRRLESFGYVQDNLYPKLRRVKFDFKLHRKGMLKDTVHTTELDTVYMRGTEALRERDYKLAVSLLRPYNCYNTAVAYVCMDYNRSALEILQSLPRDAKRDYLLAVVYSRLGDDKLAVQHFLNSVEQDEGMKLRGNLDPEINGLVKRYGIFN